MKLYDMHIENGSNTSENGDHNPHRTVINIDHADETPNLQIETPSICASIDRKKPLLKALSYLQRTQVHGSDNKHRACVCAVCDSFIIGTERIHYLSNQQILTKSSYLSVSYLENMIGVRLPTLLREQYKIEDNEELNSLLLSPRAPMKVDEQSTERLFMACHTCYNNI